MNFLEHLVLYTVLYIVRRRDDLPHGFRFKINIVNLKSLTNIGNYTLIFFIGHFKLNIQSQNMTRHKAKVTYV